MKNFTLKHRFVSITAISVAIFMLILYLNLPSYQYGAVKVKIAGVTDTKDILSSILLLEERKNVFLVESRESEENVTLNVRQTCSIESAALTNPHLKVFVVFVSKQRLENFIKTPEVEAILSYPNVFLKFIDVDKFSIGSPFQEFFAKKVLDSSLWKVEHTSDVVRLMLLWRFGGSYVDTDVIVRQKFDSIPLNYACPESTTYINGAIMNFESSKDNPLINEFVTDLITNFNGHSWGDNGPTMLTRVLRRLCDTNSTTEMFSKGNCEGFHVLRQEICYPVGGMQCYELFTDSMANETMTKVENSLAVHFWNAATKKWKLRKNQTCAYIQLAKQFCPKVMSQSNENFDV